MLLIREWWRESRHLQYHLDRLQFINSPQEFHVSLCCAELLVCMREAESRDVILVWGRNDSVHLSENITAGWKPPALVNKDCSGPKAETRVHCCVSVYYCCMHIALYWTKRLFSDMNCNPEHTYALHRVAVCENANIWSPNIRTRLTHTVSQCAKCVKGQLLCSNEKTALNELNLQSMYFISFNWKKFKSLNCSTSDWAAAKEKIR